jgi:nitrilase
MKQQTAKLAAVQASPVWLDRDATVHKACALIAEAGAAGADLVGFPENFIPGHPSWYYFHPASSEKSTALAVRLFRESVEIPGEAVDSLCRAAAEARINVVIGVTERIHGTTGTLYNTQLFINSSGELTGKHQKLVATATERLVHASGQADAQQVFDSDLGPISALICGENSNPLAAAVVSASYSRVHVASWPNNFSPSSAGMPENSLLASRNIAYSCGTYVISSCTVNSEEMIADLAATEADEVFLRDPAKTGGSCIINPAGQVIAGPLPGDEEGILYTDADFDACIRARFLHDFAGHYNRPDIYQLLVTNTRPELVSVAGLREAGRPAALVPAAPQTPAASVEGDRDDFVENT